MYVFLSYFHCVKTKIPLSSPQLFCSAIFSKTMTWAGVTAVQRLRRGRTLLSLKLIPMSRVHILTR